MYTFIKLNNKNENTYLFNNNEIINILIQEAKKSDMYYQHSACIFDGRKMVSIAHNYIPKNKLKNSRSIHAEVAALYKIPKKYKYKNLKLIVIRLSRETDTKLLFSKPCNDCYNHIKNHSIEMLYYSYGC